MKILCFGDSNTYGYDPRSFFGERYPADQRWVDLLAGKLGCEAVNAGENGREIPNQNYQLHSFDRLLSGQLPVDLLILMLGTNDLLQGNSVEAVCDRMAYFLEHIALERSKTLLIGPPLLTRGAWVPADELVGAAAALNRRYKFLSEYYGVHYADTSQWDIPLTFDGVHFTGEGHRLFASKIHTIISEKLSMQPIVDRIRCVTVENMRTSDACTIAAGTPGKVLMYRAARGIFHAVSWYGQIAVLVGSGNNGGDGFALACILQEQGFPCQIFTVSDKRSEDSAYYEELARDAHVPIAAYNDGCLEGFDILVDCLLGTGFQGIIRGRSRTAIEEINRSGAYVVSVDINSGMNGDTGEAELAVCSDLTVTIGYVKTGLISKNAGKYIKRLVCADIGIVLVEEGEEISRETAPDWLDWNVIDVRI